MSITFLQTFDVEPRTGLSEQFFRFNATLAAEQGIEALYKTAVTLLQVAASWTTSSELTLSIQLPSGMEYTIKGYSGTSMLVNHLGSGSPTSLFWVKLPAGSRVRLNVDNSSSSISNLSWSLITQSL